ncbi:MAG: chemotaxis protein CheA, partial [Chloroflexota bacterium]
AALGEICWSRPSQADVEQEKGFPNVAVLLFATEEAGKLSQAAGAVEDVLSHTVRPVTGEELAPAVGPPPAAAPPPAQPAASSEPVSTTGLVPASAQAPVPTDRAAGLAPKGPSLGQAVAAKTEKVAQNVRVDVERLDRLMNLVGELVIDRNRLQQLGVQLEGDLGMHDSLDALGEAAQHVGRITDDLQEEVMRIRMLPIESVFNKFPRLIRQLAQQLGKKVDFVVEGKETELDRSVIEKIDDPIIHLLRNSIDHGVEMPEERRASGKPETGLIKLSAWHEENHIVIAVQDDGRGMNPEALKSGAVRKGLITQEVADRMDDRAAVELIFAAGFSTAAKTTDISGRGVGMDIVRANIEKLSGFVTIETAVGRGTRFLVKLPLTLAIIRALLVGLGGQKFAIPMTTVVETLRFDPREIRTVKRHEAIQLRGTILPLISLRDMFGMSPLAEAGLHGSSAGTNGDRAAYSLADDVSPFAVSRPSRDKMFVVAVRVGDRQMGLEVDSLIGETEIVIKPLSRFLGEVPGVSGVTILGDGHVALICDVPSLLNRAAQEQLLV